MTLQEILKAKGMSDVDIESVLGEMKTNKIFTTSHENMDVRYPKLKADHESLTTQHGESTKLIEQLKSGTKDNEALQGKISGYEAQITQLQEQLKQTQLEAAIQVALIGAKATDVPYLTFQLKQKGELALDDNGHIKDIDDKLAGLKTQFPAFFESASTGKQIDPQKLPDRKQDGGGMTKAEFLRKPYAERAAYAAENPEAYKALMGN
jgi:DNA repair exonuclease SbcCD ATPase subunit